MRLVDYTLIIQTNCAYSTQRHIMQGERERERYLGCVCCWFWHKWPWYNEVYSCETVPLIGCLHHIERMQASSLFSSIWRSTKMEPGKNPDNTDWSNFHMSSYRRLWIPSQPPPTSKTPPPLLLISWLSFPPLLCTTISSSSSSSIDLCGKPPIWFSLNIGDASVVGVFQWIGREPTDKRKCGR